MNGGGSGGIVVLIIIGVVLNMLIKAMRAKTPPKSPAQRPQQPHGLGQVVERPFEDAERPEIPRLDLRPMQPRTQGTLSGPAAGVGPEGQSLEGVGPEEPVLVKQPETGPAQALKPAGTPAHPIAEWFHGDGIVRGIVMSEVLGPPMSRRK